MYFCSSCKKSCEIKCNCMLNNIMNELIGKTIEDYIVKNEASIISHPLKNT